MKSIDGIGACSNAASRSYWPDGCRSRKLASSASDDWSKAAPEGIARSRELARPTGSRTNVAGTWSAAHELNSHTHQG
jgi:hypothetical protein